MGCAASLLASSLFAGGALAQTPVTVVEYYNRALDAYFITGRSNEQSTLDVVTDFQRTGVSFSAVTAGTEPSWFNQICRYYVNTAEPFTNSHFYGVKESDCAYIASARLAGFANEGFDFAIALPTPVGCPTGAPTAVYRTFRAAANGKSSNHRYTISTAMRDSMVARGWVNEGIAFCAPSGTSAALAPSIASFENFLLNGGSYWLRFGTTTTAGQTRANYVMASVLQAGAAPGVNGARIDAPWLNLTKTLPLPDTTVWARDRVYDPMGDRINAASVDPTRYSVNYLGDAIRIDTLTREGSAMAFSTQINGAVNVPLGGRVANLPAEVLALYPELVLGALSGLNANTFWLPGAAYQKRSNTRLTDAWIVGDCAAPQTVGSIPTPCAGTNGKKLEAIFPWQDGEQGKTWQFSDGVIRMIGSAPNQLRVWVARTALPTSVSPTLGYRAFYEGDPGDPVNIGALSPSGAVIGSKAANGVVGYEVRFNKAAIDSITAALDF